MSRYVLRVDPERPLDANARMLDWFPGSQRSTVQASTDLLEDLSTPPAALDLLSVGVAAYCADRLEPRERRDGKWARDLTLTVPIVDRAGMRKASAALLDALNFVSGDHWNLKLAARPKLRTRTASARPVDAVCLFSGGLDSLTGAIDLLAAGMTVCLVSHYEAGLAPGRQNALVRQLRAHYGTAHVIHRKLFLRPASPNDLQARALPEDRENTMRGRSVLFISAGLAVASGYGPDIPLFIPENGLIGINVPLTGARPASLSTRTTHPYFMSRLSAAAVNLGIPNELVNPYRLATKGEMLAGCRDSGTLSQLADETLSCAHPEAGRLHRRSVGNCGYCFPCLIRRSALHHVHADNGSRYAVDALADATLLDLADAGADLRALLLSLGRPATHEDVLRNGPVSADDIPAFADTHRRGRRELRNWLLSRAHRRIRDALTHDVP